MALLEIIAQLSPASSAYESSSRATDSVNRLQKTEIAGLLAGLDEMATLLAYAKYADDVRSESLLIAKVKQWVLDRAMAEGWECSALQSVVINIASLVVFEVVRPNVCQHCDGNRYVRFKPCEVCDATGVRRLSGRTIAAALGVPDSTYRLNWRGRYGDAYRFVLGLDDQVKIRVSINNK